MSASLNDLLTATENGGPAVPSTASDTRVIGATTLQCETLTQWPTVTKVHFVTGAPTTDTEGNPIINPATLCLWEGIVSGSQINNLTLRYSATITDPGNNIDDIVQMAPDSSWANDLYEWGIVDHDTEGHHNSLHDTNGNVILALRPTASAVNELQLQNAATGNAPTITATGTDTNVSLNLATTGTGKVESNGNALWQYLGYITYGGGNQTTTSTSFVAMTGMTITVSVPANATVVRLTANALLQGSVNGDGICVAVYKDGTYLAQRYFNVPGTNYESVPSLLFYDGTPTSGSHTYALYFASSASGNTVTFVNGAPSSTPFQPYNATLMVECV